MLTTVAYFIMDHGSPSSQIEIIKKVIKLPVLVGTYKLIKSRSSESEYSEQHSPTLSDLDITIKCSTSYKVNTRRILLKQGNIDLDCDFNLNYNAFAENTVLKETYTKQYERAKKKITLFILLSNTHA